jgi:hypothetical protein
VRAANGDGGIVTAGVVFVFAIEVRDAVREWA